MGSLSLAENIALPIHEFTALSPELVDDIVHMKLEMVGLRGFETLLPAELSGGMRKRAALARAIALDPEILFCDEPSAGLDPVTSAELDELLLELKRALGITMVLVTHELPSIEAISDRCIMLDGKARGIIATGAPEELRRDHPDPRVQAFFRRQARRRD
jgi:phospholipid/cholesterol/gamma-HCH transport system ATP-binding protein